MSSMILVSRLVSYLLLLLLLLLLYLLLLLFVFFFLLFFFLVFAVFLYTLLPLSLLLCKVHYYNCSWLRSRRGTIISWPTIGWLPMGPWGKYPKKMARWHRTIQPKEREWKKDSYDFLSHLVVSQQVEFGYSVPNCHLKAGKILVFPVNFQTTHVIVLVIDQKTISHTIRIQYTNIFK